MCKKFGMKNGRTGGRNKSLLLGAASAALILPMLVTGPAFGQEDDEDGQLEEITVTGSRIKRDVFSSTTPIQVLDTEAAQRIGIISISELLQKSTISNGEQIDGSFSSNAGQTNASEAPPDGGVGSACINLRGLGCERTLVLVNGKRLGLSGIRGAPPQPDINVIPIGMVEAVDVLTGGLSTVYGADAVAGVVNVRLKRDFEGINLTFNTEQPTKSGGEIFQTSLVGGVSNDSGNITFGMEYSTQNRVRTGNRSYSRCLRRGTSGISVGLNGEKVLNCRSDFPDNWLTTAGVDLFASGELVAADGTVPSPVDGTRLIYTPGSSNINWGANGLNPGQPVTGFSLFSSLPQPGSSTIAQFPGGSTGTRPFFLDRFRYDPRTNDQLDRADADLWRPYERFSLVMNGHQDLGWGNNEEFYFEGYYFNRTNDVIAAREQIFPAILGQIPLVDSSNIPILDANGAIQMVDNPMNPFSVDLSPVLTLDDVAQTFDTELQQVRLVGGITGDLPFNDKWSYDVSATYDRSTGFVAQPILLENNLFFATQNLGAVADSVTGLPTGEVVCSPRFASLAGGFITPPECVPVDFFAASIPGDSITTSGSFGSQAERDYLIQKRTNRTVTEQVVFQGFLTGDLFDISGGGTVGTAIGIEFREDKINSQNSAAGVLGLNAAENPLQEGETRGTRDTFDIYGEISAPIIVDASWAEVVQLDAALRLTDDENFGKETVYKVGGLWRVNEYVALSSSFNTAFRAPNLREQFLADQAGALPGGSDPCHSQSIALATPGPALDRLLGNCLLSGADVNQLGSAFTVAIPTSTGGAAGLKPETSDSLTATLTLSQPFTERFDFDLALTYFDIEIKDTVRALDPGTIVSRCYNDEPNLASPFCDRVFRNRPSATPLNNFISFVRAGFVNTGVETATGMDFTTRFAIDFERTDINWTTATTFMDERRSQEFPPSEADPDGSPIVNNIGRIGNPEWTFQSTLAVSFAESWDIVFQSRYWSDTRFRQGVVNPVITDVNGLCLSGCPVGQDPNDIFGNDWNDFGFSQSSQIPLSVGPTRPVVDAAGQWQHDLGISYNFESGSVTIGVNNMLDKAPPLISQGAGPNRNNAVASGRYDLIGRSYFVNFNWGF
ncbi:MAG: TonB-dependent receptor plug domain-containing protein [Gammaproteobacteria bacterium]|nr:TonB-dependent receptor plug domain-containing protein [Gammaproteobacteria bacterium]